MGADKAYDSKDFVRTVRELNVAPHITKNDKNRSSNLDRRTTRQPGYAISLSRRWLIEKGFGWLKQTGPLRQVELRGLEKVDWLFVFSCAAHKRAHRLKFASLVNVDSALNVLKHKSPGKADTMQGDSRLWVGVSTHRLFTLRRWCY